MSRKRIDLGVIHVTVDCPICPNFAVALEPAEVQTGRPLALVGKCDCGTTISAYARLTRIKVEPPSEEKRDGGEPLCPHCDYGDNSAPCLCLARDGSKEGA